MKGFCRYLLVFVCRVLKKVRDQRWLLFDLSSEENGVAVYGDGEDCRKSGFVAGEREI